MKVFGRLLVLCFVCWMRGAFAQATKVEPQIVTENSLEGNVAVVEVAPRFVTTVRLPEAVNSVVVGDPSQFQVEHSEKEPRLIFVKAISTKPAETNLLISMTNGHQVSLLLANRGETSSANRNRVDFLVRYEPASEFFVAPTGFPFALVGETVPLAQTPQVSMDATGKPYRIGTGASLASFAAADPPATRPDAPRANVQNDGLDKLLEQQENAPLPLLYGEHITEEPLSGDRVRAGISRVVDGGQQVIVLFSVVNPTKHPILLMPPQVQLGGRTISGKVIRHKKWSTAEQLPVGDFRLSKRRVGPGERADGVVLFERPPYKQSNETLLLQIAEAGAVDRPALAPIGFGIGTALEDRNGRGE